MDFRSICDGTWCCLRHFFLTWIINVGVDPASVCVPHQWPVVTESCPTPAPWTAPAGPPRSSPRVRWALVNVSCAKSFCWAGVGTWGSSKGGSETGFPHNPSTRRTEIWGIILRSCSLAGVSWEAGLRSTAGGVRGIARASWPLPPTPASRSPAAILWAWGGRFDARGHSLCQQLQTVSSPDSKM